MCTVLCFSSNPQSGDVPPPESVLGFKPGADCRLADWEMMRQYFHELDAASDRVFVRSIGKSSMGRDILLVVVTSAENMAGKAGIMRACQRLADPAGLSLKEAEAMVSFMPACVFVGCAQHSSEIGSTQMSMILAHHLAADESPEMDRIRKNTVLLLVPSMNPDGHQIVCDWYNDHVGTPFEASRRPWLYHKYVGHDINRDWAMNTQVETRNISRVLYEEWFPQIVFDVHQMGSRGARMFIPPYYDPINPNIDPMIQHELSLITSQMKIDLSIAGHKGIITNAMFDEWLLGYMTSVPTRHNMVSQLIEMASVNTASPIFLRRSELSNTRGLDEYVIRANFPEPWEGGWWRLNDIVEYEHTALLSVLDLASKNKDQFLINFYNRGIKQIETGKTEPPFAFLVPSGQDDPATAWKMIEVLMRGGVKVHRAREGFEADGVPYASGTIVILMSQPFRAHAKDLLERQFYPNMRDYPGGPPQRPYDMTGWSLPLLMGVKCVEVVNPFDADLVKAEKETALPQGAVYGFGSDSNYLMIERCQNNAFIFVNRQLAAGVKVRTLTQATQETEMMGRDFSAGTFVIGAKDGLPDGIVSQLKGLGLVVYACSDLPDDAPLNEVGSVRLGLYQPWTASMDEGWTRWVLEQFEFPYVSLHDAEIRAGGLEKRYDAIVLPDLRQSSIIEGNSEGSMPGKYTGGIGEQGVFALRDFVREGGRIIAMDSSCDFLIDKLELPVKNTVSRKERRSPSGDDDGFFCPGSILRVNMNTADPLAFGLDAACAILNANSPVFEAFDEKDKGKKDERETVKNAAAKAVIVGTYPKVNPLMSGWVENDSLIHGKGVLVRAAFGKGDAVLIGFRCQFRAQSHGTFKVLFNAILNANM